MLKAALEALSRRTTQATQVTQATKRDVGNEMPMDADVELQSSPLLGPPPSSDPVSPPRKTAKFSVKQESPLKPSGKDMLFELDEDESDLEALLNGFDDFSQPLRVDDGVNRDTCVALTGRANGPMRELAHQHESVLQTREKESQFAQSIALPHQPTRSQALHSQALHSQALHSQSAPLKAPPQQSAPLKAPPQQLAHSQAPPQQSAPSQAPPQQPAHSQAPPQQSAHSRAPPQQPAPSQAPPQQPAPSQALHSQNLHARHPLPIPQIVSLSQSVVFDEVPSARAHLVRLVPRVVIAETFVPEQLAFNVQAIGAGLCLDPLRRLRTEAIRRATFSIGVMVKSFQMIGPLAQMCLCDGSGEEMSATLLQSALSELSIKLHFGLIFVLDNVSVYSPIPRAHYLNVTLANISAVYLNVREIN